MRLFNIEVFNGTIQGTNINVTSTELQEVLGRADVIILEIEVMRATAGAQLNVEIQHSNSGRRFRSHTSFNLSNLTSPPVLELESAGDDQNPLGGRVQITFAMNGSTEEAAVRAVAVGRGK